MMKINKLLMIVLCLSYSSLIANSLLMKCNIANINMNLQHKSIIINSKKITGKGTIDSDEITIACDKFKFTGSIKCDGKCVICCKEPFDYTKFTKEGSGKITIIISNYDFEPITESVLLHAAPIFIVTDFLSKTDSAINNQIELMRHYAFSNNISQNSLLQSINKELNKQIIYYKTHLHQFDYVNCLKNHPILIPVSLYLAWGIVASIFKLGIDLQYNWHNIKIFDKTNIMIGGMIVGYYSIFSFTIFKILSYCYNKTNKITPNPQQVKIDKLFMMKDLIKARFNEEKSCEKMQIINL